MALWHWYWNMSEGNVIATPLCMIFEGVLVSVLGYVFRKQIRRVAAWFSREKSQALADAREDAAKARAIAADLYRHLTGSDHPHAPAPGE